ncbi:hypothetical protein M9H77_30690 [Catharanthus roseus]|uniref:Uncharacterized protein n=1 Tax=Catharanthus roseus TaxID=4058 RepID=A0ACB9ZXY6_CATRO|nr:hypothetical protein M9H77_30690 [Catharanthus roseus]
MGKLVSRDDAKEHLIARGFIRGYTRWVKHGEYTHTDPSTSSSHIIHDDLDGNDTNDIGGLDDMDGLVHDAFGIPRVEVDGENDMGTGLNNTSKEELNVEANVGNRYNEGVHKYVNEEIAGITHNEDAGDIEATNENNEQVTEEINQQKNFPDVMRRNTRGPTKMMHMGRPKCKNRIKLEFNNNGESIGETASSFSKFVGTEVKDGKDIPIGVFDWGLVPKDKKLKVFTQIKIPLGIDDLILQSMGKKWRNFKVTLKEK